MKIRNYGLTLVLLICFLIFISGQFFTGFKTHNDERLRERLEPLTSYSQYFKSGHFMSSVAENMESEFLQMAFYVYLTMCLYQVGSAESKKPPEEMTAAEQEEDENEKQYSAKKRLKHPVLWRIYENSLTLAMLSLFLISFMAHARGSYIVTNEENLSMGRPEITFWAVFKENEFWFESFQNWQSEFFSIAVMVVLSIFLRQKNSEQSKKMSDPQWKTGNS